MVKKRWDVLGDPEEYTQILAETTPKPPEPEPLCVTNSDPNNYPSDVWQAAEISPDKGATILQTFRELEDIRGKLHEQLVTMRTNRILDTSKPNKAMGSPEKFNDRQREWEYVASNLASKLGRNAGDLAMLRGDNFRAQQEASDMLQQAIPVTERVSGLTAWQMSLRDNWERIVPVGNMFSGLYLAIKEKSPAEAGRTMLVVKQPAPVALDAATITSTTYQGQGPAPQDPGVRGRGWVDSEYLKQRQHEFRKGLHAVLPHAPDVDGLVLHGQSMEAMLIAQAEAPITLEEVERHLAYHQPDAYEQYTAAKEAHAARMAASMAAASVVEAVVAAAEEEEIAAALPQPGPHVECSSEEVFLTCNVADSTSSTVTLTSKGTAAMYYKWVRQEPRKLPHSAPAPALPCFYLSHQQGVLLPGQVLDIKFTFKCPHPGIYQEQWLLTTLPELVHPAPRVTLRGISTIEDNTRVKRAALANKLAEQEKNRKVAAALERILINATQVHPYPEPPTTPTQQQQLEAFDKANTGAQPTLYYHPEIYAQLRELYASVQTRWHALMNPPEPEVVKGKKGPASGSAKKGQAPPPPPAPPKFPETWDNRIATLKDLLHDTRALPLPVGAAPDPELDTLATRCDVLCSSLVIPRSRGVVVRHAMRAVVNRLADELDSKLAALQELYDKKNAPEAEEGERGGEGGQGEEGEEQEEEEEDDTVYDEEWLQGQRQDLVTAALTHTIVNLGSEIDAEISVVSDNLEVTIRELQDRIASPSTRALQQADLQWQLFAEFRKWTRLGCPPRGDIK